MNNSSGKDPAVEDNSEAEQQQHLRNRNPWTVLDTTAPRIYAKDLTCPAEIKAALDGFLPEYLLPFTASDLFSCMPPRLAADHLMCYVGSNGTGTAMHRDICGTLGHNIMTYADEGGFSEWIFIPKEQRDKLLKAVHPSKKEIGALPPGAIDTHSDAMGGGLKSLYVESDRAWVYQSLLKQAEIKTQVIIQRPGDLVLIPSMCYHQVRNVGTSVKVAWNRASAYSLRLALEEQLPIYQNIIRPELYRCKAMVYHALCDRNKKMRAYLKSGDRRPNFSPWFREECEILCNTFLKQVIYPEMIEAIPAEDVDDDDIEVGMSGTSLYTKTCNFCCADIFNRHYHCEFCQDFDLCLRCYSQGRGCAHLDTLTMYEGSTSLQRYLDVYASFIETMNEAFERFTEDWEPLAYMLKDEDQKMSLATVCRRIEAYRHRNGLLSNYYVCGHCNALASLHDLYTKEHIGLEAIFGRHRLCKALAENDTGNIVYVCNECAKTCDSGCEPMSIQRPEVIQKVYYIPPGDDSRNWGSPVDWGMRNSTYWPRRNQVPIEWTNVDLQDLVHNALAEAIKEENLPSILANKERAAAAASRLRDVAKDWEDQLAKELMEHPTTERIIQLSSQDDSKDLVGLNTVSLLVPANVTIKKQPNPVKRGRPKKQRRMM